LSDLLLVAGFFSALDESCQGLTHFVSCNIWRLALSQFITGVPIFGVWMIPIFSAVVWLAMLLAMLVWWINQGSPIYESMQPGQTIAYISDVGAQDLKPLFVAMAAITVVSFDLVFVAQRWLRHKGKLAQNTSWIQKIFNILATLTAIAGAAGLVLLAIFDTVQYPRLHDGFLAIFIAGYVISAVFICLEYWRLERRNRDRAVLRVSFYIKLLFILVEVGLAIAFGVTQHLDEWNSAAIIEWTIALIFTFYVLSFVIDFLPSARTDSGSPRAGDAEAAMNQPPPVQTGAGRFYGNGSTKQYTSPYIDGMGPGARM